MTDEKYLTTQEVADRLGVHRRTVARMCKDRKIKYITPTPRKLLIKEEWLQEYLNGQIVEPITEKENENNE